MEKEKFYIFLDIDGVMWDWKFIKREIKLGNLERGGIIETYDPKCMNALNFLMEKLNQNYNVQLVISSSERKNISNTITLLYKQNLKYKGNIEATPITYDNIRGKEIVEYLTNKPNKENYCVIDDETSNIIDFVPKKHIIKTEIFLHSLKMEQVKNFLKNLDIDNSKDTLGK